ncbi:MFS transporter [Lichenihabitans psoromatis]|uniref:MFS transporter n=1 Tax=Lichenihabitans psoromatis TaxID=2528642 RepID=UPI0010384613|nr:MFS transporter [Lichenihabitans psoromatis]
MRDLEATTLSKLRWRLLPFLLLCYLVAYLDRVNVSIAALQMNKDLGFTPTVYSIGSGIFFLGYFMFELPSNWTLERVGARTWIARIMITWGLLAGCTAFVWNGTSFYWVRLILGAAEAGFLPGIIFYLSLWFPARQRAVVMSTFFLGVPLSFVIGAPLSGALLGLDGALGIKGWQWLFLLEGAPAVLLGICCLLVLVDRPKDAVWLDAAERNWLTGVLQAEQVDRAGAASTSFWAALSEPGVYMFGIAYMGINMGIYGIGLWMPQIIKQVGYSNLITSLLSAFPYLIAAIVMVFWARHSDRTGERRWHAVIPCVVCSVGLVGSAFIGGTALAYAALTCAAIGIMTSMATFWAMPTGVLAGSAAAGGIALINSVGNLGGFGGAYLVGYLRDSTNSFQSSLVFLAICPLVAAFILYVMADWKRATRLGHAPSAPLRKVG